MLQFHKYQGSGNDFIIINNWEKNCNLDQATIQKMCHRNFGIGSDGIILIERTDLQADFKMVFFNPDGSESVCGNGCRCAVRAARDFGLINYDQCRFEAQDGIHNARILNENDVQVELLNAQVFKMNQQYFIIFTGTYHYVEFIENVHKIDLATKGRCIRYDKNFEVFQGVNVNFVEQTPEGFYMRTFEKGVNAETLSCGTGAAAVAIAAHILELGKPPYKIKNNSSSFLSVDFQAKDMQFSHLTIAGPATYVFKGQIQLPQAT